MDKLNTWVEREFMKWKIDQKTHLRIQIRDIRKRTINIISETWRLKREIPNTSNNTSREESKKNTRITIEKMMDILSIP